jgi:RimJ/RimL family protein N-acetyltransferase
VAQLSAPRQTSRLTLRQPQLSDLDDLALIYADEAVNRYLYSDPRDRMQALASLERTVARPLEITDENILIAAVVLRDTGRVIGDFILQWTRNEHRQGEIGGSLHPDFHGKGFATEVYHELIDIAFSEFSLHRVIGRCDARNAASIRSLEKAGLRQEAHFIENEFVKGEWTDEVVLAIRRDQWAQLRITRTFVGGGPAAPIP